MLENLNLKEITAIELKYLGNSHLDISEKIEVPKMTIDEWFKERGKLYNSFRNYKNKTNEKRQKEIEKSLIESDENILVTTTFIMRRIKFLVDKSLIKLTFSDFRKAWEIQRIMQGKPTDVKSQNMNFDQERLDEEAETIREIINKASEEKEEEGG